MRATNGSHAAGDRSRAARGPWTPLGRWVILTEIEMRRFLALGGLLFGLAGCDCGVPVVNPPLPEAGDGGDAAGRQSELLCTGAEEIASRMVCTNPRQDTANSDA